MQIHVNFKQMVDDALLDIIITLIPQVSHVLLAISSSLACNNYNMVSMQLQENILHVQIYSRTAPGYLSNLTISTENERARLTLFVYKKINDI